MLFIGTRMAGDQAAPFQTNDRLFRTLQTVLAISKIIVAIDVKNMLDFERDHAFYDGKATAAVRKGFKIN